MSGSAGGDAAGPSNVVVLANACQAWGPAEWGSLSRAVAQHAATADRSVLVVVNDADGHLRGELQIEERLGARAELVAAMARRRPAPAVAAGSSGASALAAGCNGAAPATGGWLSRSLSPPPPPAAAGMAPLPAGFSDIAPRSDGAAPLPQPTPPSSASGSSDRARFDFDGAAPTASGSGSPSSASTPSPPPHQPGAAVATTGPSGPRPPFSWDRMRSDLEVPWFDGHAAHQHEADSLLAGIGLLKQAPADARAAIHRHRCMAFAEIAAEHMRQAGGLDCVFSAGPETDTVLANPDSLPHRIPSVLVRDVKKWFATMAKRVVVVPAIVTDDADRADLHACVLAACLKATHLEVWGDSLGMFTAEHPHIVHSARLLSHLSYNEAREICSLIPHRLHPLTIEVAHTADLTISMRSVLRPQVPGTIIEHAPSSLATPLAPRPKMVTLQTGVTVLCLTPLSAVKMWHVSGFLSKVFQCFESNHVSVNLLASASTNLTVALDQLDDEVHAELIRELARLCSVEEFNNCRVLTVVGHNIAFGALRLSPHLEGNRLLMISHSAHEIGISFVLASGKENIELDIHQQLFAFEGAPPAHAGLGPTHTEIYGSCDATALCMGQCSLDDNDEAGAELLGNELAGHLARRWWWPRRDELCELLKGRENPDQPVYVYSRQVLAARMEELRAQVPAIGRFFYAIKANSNPHILRLVHEHCLGFECVSEAELKHVQGLFPDLPAERLLFTPNFCSRAEFEAGIRLGAFVTVDNLFCLQSWPELFRERAIIVRVDLGEGHGHHDYVKTGGSASKFGVAVPQLADLADICRRNAITVIGLHVHAGSGNSDPSLWAFNASQLAKIAKESFPSVRYLNLGGGLGIPYRLDAKHMDLQRLNSHLQGFLEKNKNWELWMEPGRFVVAECGALLCRVTQIKHKSGINFVGVTAGMTSLIRPPLYSAYHAICNLSQPVPGEDKDQHMIANVCGPICESGDVMGWQRPLPANTQEGDVMVIDAVGAYGRCMGSTYNLRVPGDEIILS